jgi:hypothetical protein
LGCCGPSVGQCGGECRTPSTTCSRTFFPLWGRRGTEPLFHFASASRVGVPRDLEVSPSPRLCDFGRPRVHVICEPNGAGVKVCGGSREIAAVDVPEAVRRLTPRISATSMGPASLSCTGKRSRDRYSRRRLADGSVSRERDDRPAARDPSHPSWSGSKAYEESRYLGRSFQPRL